MPEFPGRLRPPRLASAPSSPAEGETYYDTVAKLLYYWNGTTWTAMPAPFVICSNAPQGVLPRAIPFTLPTVFPISMLVVSCSGYPSANGLMAINCRVDALSILQTRIFCNTIAGQHYTCVTAVGSVGGSLAAGAHNLNITNAANANMDGNDHVTAYLQPYA